MAWLAASVATVRRRLAMHDRVCLTVNRWSALGLGCSSTGHVTCDYVFDIFRNEELSKPPSATHPFCAHSIYGHVSTWGDPVDAVQC